MRHLMSPLDLSVEELDKLLTLANDIEKNPKNSAAATGSGSTTVFTELFRTVRRKWLSRK